MTARRGIVAAGHPLTAEAAELVLREGGNAFDAALAAFAAACVAEPVLASIGGGGFLLGIPDDGRARLYDFFVQTPGRPRPPGDLDFREVHADFGPATQAFHIGRGTVAVPGAVAGLFRVHRDLGAMPVREVLAPAIRLAGEGVEITEFQAYLFRVVGAIYTATPRARAVFGARRAEPGAGGGAGTIETGERLRLPELADVLECLGAEGEDLFYRGEVGRALLETVAEGGQLEAADLAAYRAELRRPLEIAYGGARILTNPPPASGGVLVGFGLEMLRGSGLGALEHGDPRRLEWLARVLAATGEARLEAAGGDGGADLERLLGTECLERWRARLAPHAPARRGTTHISVLDAAGRLASLTASNGEGCGHLVPGAGFMPNNMLGEADLNPGGFHRWRPGSRMTSMMAPSAVCWPDGRRVATGSGGSNRIRSALVQVLVNLVDHEMPVEPAVLAPRIHVEQGLLSVEGGFDVERLAPLLEAWPRHQIWEMRNLFFGGAHTAAGGRGGFEGAGDPRRGGVCRVI